MWSFYYFSGWLGPSNLECVWIGLDRAAVVQAGWLKIFWITYGIAQRLASRSVPLLTAISTGLYNHDRRNV